MDRASGASPMKQKKLEAVLFCQLCELQDDEKSDRHDYLRNTAIQTFGEYV